MKKKETCEVVVAEKGTRGLSLKRMRKVQLVSKRKKKKYYEKKGVAAVVEEEVQTVSSAIMPPIVGPRYRPFPPDHPCFKGDPLGYYAVFGHQCGAKVDTARERKLRSRAWHVLSEDDRRRCVEKLASRMNLYFEEREELRQPPVFLPDDFHTVISTLATARREEHNNSTFVHVKLPRTAKDDLVYKRALYDEMVCSFVHRLLLRSDNPSLDISGVRFVCDLKKNNISHLMTKYMLRKDGLIMPPEESEKQMTAKELNVDVEQGELRDGEEDSEEEEDDEEEEEVLSSNITVLLRYKDRFPTPSRVFSTKYCRGKVMVLFSRSPHTINRGEDPLRTIVFKFVRDRSETRAADFRLHKTEPPYRWPAALV